MRTRTRLERREARFQQRRGQLVVVNDVRWKWSCGWNTVTAYSEYGYRLCVPARAVNGRPAEIFQHGQWKGSSDCTVTPEQAKAWITKQNHGT